SKMSKYYGIDIIYMSPKDIDIDNNTVEGKVLVGEEWNQKIVEIPKLIDISPYCFNRKNRKIIRYLRNKSYLTDNRTNTINKEQLQEELRKDERFSHLVIPTKRLESVDDVKE